MAQQSMYEFSEGPPFASCFEVNVDPSLNKAYVLAMSTDLQQIAHDILLAVRTSSLHVYF